MRKSFVKTWGALVMTGAMLGGSQEVFCENQTTTLGLFAEVSSTITLNVQLFKNEAWTTEVSDMNFGSLKEVEFPNPDNPDQPYKSLRSSEQGSTGTAKICAVVSANTHGLPYTITQTGTILSNGASQIPAGACVVVPVYVADDNGGYSMPSGSQLGVNGSWVTTNKVLCMSNASGQSFAFRGYYSITDDPNAGATEAVPIDQRAGTYTGVITFTVTV
ncbi:MAG: hypothetical protein HY593_06235 [Candidatus Omnitrophica bacterium]|nr:hypothetical protein [Candidatus Omnitrophota bacterium]